MRLKTSPKLECPYKIPELRSPLRPASLPPSGLALHSPQASQIHSNGWISQWADHRNGANHTGCRPTRSGKAQGPLRPISGPRRCRPRCRREYAHLCDLPRCGDPPIAISTRCGDPPIVKSTCWDNPPIVKTKNSASLQLFCDCELFPVPAKRKRGLHTANYLRFCAAIRDWGARNNCQSQKSCNSDRFFVSGLLE